MSIRHAARGSPSTVARRQRSLPRAPGAHGERRRERSGAPTSSGAAPREPGRGYCRGEGDEADTARGGGPTGRPWEGVPLPPPAAGPALTTVTGDTMSAAGYVLLALLTTLPAARPPAGARF